MHTQREILRTRRLLHGDVGGEDLLRAARLVFRGVVDARFRGALGRKHEERQIVFTAAGAAYVRGIDAARQIGIVGGRKRAPRRALTVLDEREADSRAHSVYDQRETDPYSTTSSGCNAMSQSSRHAGCEEQPLRDVLVPAERAAEPAAAGVGIPARSSSACTVPSSPCRRAARGIRDRPRRARAPKRRSAGPTWLCRAAACRSCRRTGVARRRGRAARSPSRKRSPVTAAAQAPTTCAALAIDTSRSMLSPPNKTAIFN